MRGGAITTTSQPASLLATLPGDRYTDPGSSPGNKS